VKDLLCLGRPLSDTIIVDNSPHSYVFQVWLLPFFRIHAVNNVPRPLQGFLYVLQMYVFAAGVCGTHWNIH